MMVPISYVHIGIGFLTTVVSIPLVLRKVPMNRVYGVRIRKSFISEHNWYEINAYGGKLLLAFGLFILAFGWLGQDIAPPPTSLWAPVFLLVPLLTMIPILAFINAFARRMPDR